MVCKTGRSMGFRGVESRFVVVWVVLEVSVISGPDMEKVSGD